MPLARRAATSHAGSMKSNPYLPVSSRRASTEGLRLRPDTLVMSFSCAVRDVTPQRAVELLRAGVTALEHSLQAVAPEGSVHLDNFETHRHVPKLSKKKSKGPAKVSEHRCGVSGEVRWPLRGDFWSRSVQLAQLVELADVLKTEAERRTPSLYVSYGEAEARIAQPEAHRSALLEQWVGRQRELAGLAGSEALPLHVLDLAPVGAVQQQTVSLEEVELSLAVSGRLDAAPRPQSA